jgi:hypothetical protein
MNYYKYKNKNITPALVEKWIESLLKDYDSDELLQMLFELTANKQRSLLIEEMESQLKYLDYNVLKCKTLDEKIKYEEFLDEIKPYYNERSLFE